MRSTTRARLAMCRGEPHAGVRTVEQIIDESIDAANRIARQAAKNLNKINDPLVEVIDALKWAEHELAFLGGCTHTDRPDLPLSPETSWTTDVSGVLAAVANAIRALSGPRTDLGCAGCSSCQQTLHGTRRRSAMREEHLHEMAAHAAQAFALSRADKYSDPSAFGKDVAAVYLAAVTAAATALSPAGSGEEQ